MPVEDTFETARSASGGRKKTATASAAKAAAAAAEILCAGRKESEDVIHRDMAREFDLAASRGSDFHSPDESHTDLGSLPWLPGNLTPVWELLADRIQ